MSVPGKSLLAAGTAFAAGVAVTAALVGGGSGTEPVRHGMMSGAPGAPARAGKVAALPAAPSGPQTAPQGEGPSAGDGWVDPVRDRAAAPAGKPPLPPLVFHVDREPEPAKDATVRTGARADEGSARQAATAAPPPRPPASELVAPSAPHREAASAIAAAVGSPGRRSLVLAPRPQAPRQAAMPSRKAGGPRIATGAAEQDDAHPAVARPPRRISTARRDYADMASDDAATRHGPVLDRYERDVADRAPAPRRRVTSAESGGVLRWLEQP